VEDHGYHDLTVKAVVDETPDTRSFVLDVPADLRDLYRYRAGQFCTFRVPVDGDVLMRCYSMSSAPEVDADLTVTVKRVPNGAVSNWLNDHVAEGDVLQVTKPAGVFCAQDGDRPIVAFAGGSGITPVISIAKSVRATSDRPVRLLYANRDADSVIFEKELADLDIEVRHHLDADGGYLQPAAITEFVGGDRDADFHLCGPTPFMDLVEATLVDLGVPTDRIFIERFSVPDPVVPDVTEGAGGDVPDRVTIILEGKTNEVAYQPGDTVLETARRSGLRAPSSCEAGNCATCMAMLHEGAVRMRTNNALTADEVEEGWILTCQSLPEGPACTVEYESL
jgi:ferredoxin-NADP reductase